MTKMARCNMKRLRCYQLGCVLLSLCSLLLFPDARPGSTAPKTNPKKVSTKKLNTKAEVVFLRAIPARATLAQIKRLWPRGTRVTYHSGRVVLTERSVGTLVRFEGTFAGLLEFLSPRQYQILKTRQRQRKDKAGSPDVDNPPLNYRSSDPFKIIHLYMDGGRTATRAEGQQRLRLLRSVLGRPRQQAYHDPDKELPSSPDYGSGWAAEWRLSDGRIIFFTAEDGMHGKRKSVLTLVFPYTRTYTY